MIQSTPVISPLNDEKLLKKKEKSGFFEWPGPIIDFYPVEMALKGWPWMNVGEFKQFYKEKSV